MLMCMAVVREVYRVFRIALSLNTSPLGSVSQYPLVNFLYAKKPAPIKIIRINGIRIPRMIAALPPEVP
jgi:hypothetical protein